LKVYKSLCIFVFLANIFGFVYDAFAAGDPSVCVVTIKSVQLKKDSGEWITVIEPDHQVDLVSQEPTVSFFNNGRRVPPGDYSNFKILLLKMIKGKDAKHLSFIYESPKDEIVIYGRKDFLQFLKVKVGSFISVWFGVDLSNTTVGSGSEVTFLPPKEIKEATVTVDEQKITIPSSELRVDF
jgi:hypothetical protein